MAKTGKYCLYAGICILSCLLLQKSYSTVRQPDLTLSASLCSQFSSLSLNNMNTQQAALSKECDIIESSHDWEREYGHLNETELLAGVVYE